MSETAFVSKRGLIRAREARADGSSINRNLDLSITLAPSEIQRLLDSHNTSNLNNSGNFSMLPESTSNFLGTEPANSGRSILENNELDIREKANMLFPQFLEVLQSHNNDSEVFDTIQDIIHICSGIVDELDRDGMRTMYIKQKCEEHLWFEQEHITWKLLYALYKDRIMVQTEPMEEVALGCSDKEVISQLYSCNSHIREYQLIVDWLEACYVKDETMHVGHSTDRTVAWENTLFQLQNPHDVAFSNGRETIKSLDPDAPVREKKRLHPLDEEDNLRLSKGIFAEIRQGKIDEAMALCKYCGQTWRAALLEGWRLYEDPNYESANPREKIPVEGNPRRDIWKKCAWMMADSNKFDEYTRAIAGALCGHLESLKAVLSKSWLDLLWAYLKVQIDIRVESEIRSIMPQEYWDNKMSLEQIFNELSVHKNESVKKEARDKMHTIQKYIILDNIPEMLQKMKLWVEEEKLSPHMLRFLSHIVLFMRQIGKVDKEEIADVIIKAFVECLIELKEPQLVAFYTASLPSKMQVMLYSKFLETIKETSARAAALEEAVSAGLDVQGITKHTVQTIRTRVIDEEVVEQRQQGDISQWDLEKIKALEWLTFYPEQKGELLWQANALSRTFLAQGKTECMRAAFNIVPADALAQIISIYGSKDNFPCREECSIKEYLSYKVYLVALDGFNDWSQLYHNRPKEPQAANVNANFTERIASEHKEQSYRSELDRWKMNLNEQTSVTRDALFNILLFPEKGWLVDPDSSKNPANVDQLDWENRLHQLQKLRSVCIPEIVLLLHKVLQQSGDYKGCIKLADEISSELRQLYKVYTKHKLAELLAKISESCLTLLNEKLDPWGYQSTA
ncbi:nuclear pore complex protein Nup107 [Eupeodes corollae]|uniref:nuclear pore complex protein Nup107 n=1 Tax=Eupeodes corollae TaxID=290404 RepID=UPI0024934EA1|nr:nuclear pore complex protein Nup107 [Eupeodes corollae]